MVLILFTSGSLLEGFLNVIITMLLSMFGLMLFYPLDREGLPKVIIFLILRSSWWYIRVYVVGIPIVIIVIRVKTFNNPLILLVIVRKPSCCVLF